MTTRTLTLKAFGLSAVIALASAIGAPGFALAQDADLEGAWTGAGRVVLPSGASERATCRVNFRRQSQTSFRVSAVCATASTRVAQTAVVQRVSGNQFSGSFYNQEFDVSGRIRMTARGANRLSVSLDGGGASSEIELRR